ncbi:hypothetical protein [Paraburkholderia saeva]|uniref:hypothetical protein n=1 Tax=Paraburkholderia saeva TaxID=2777537 RepID=UPI001DA1CE3F|nr:hypothetical protein [Paraburkholderia saeva]CAG4891059.1 hypothetical protein R52603_01093 [Paraburkholderia saeva]
MVKAQGRFGARQSRLFSITFAMVGGGISSYVNFADGVWAESTAQPQWMLITHVASAVVGSVLLSRFIFGAMSALFEAPTSAVYASGKLANGVAIRYRVDQKETFFSLTRFLQILGFVLCVMLQGVSVAAESNAAGSSKSGAPSVGAHPHRQFST